MKKKFSIWLNIVTICLCMCAIMVGVYAATSATLTVSGQIGFTAHGVEGSVTAATIEGHAVKNGADDKDGMPSEAVSLLSLKQDSTTEYVPVAFNDANGIKLGTKYFSDLQTADGTTTDIVIRLTISNTSKFDIVAYIDDSATALPTNVITNNDTIPSVKIAKDGTGTLVIGLKLQKVKNTSGVFEYVDFNTDGSLKKLDIQLGFDKYVAPTYTTGKVDIKGTTGSTVNHLITTMGKDSTGKDIRWYAIAKSTDGGANFTSIAKTNTTEVASGTYIFISEYILPIQNTTLGSSGYIAYTNTNNPNYAESFGINYNGSTIQQYLNGHGANTFAKEYNISDSSVYANISAVDLAGESCADYRDSTTYTTQDTDNQKLWLLSETEYTTYFGAGDSSGIGYFNGSADCWWLRSPINVTPYYALAHCVSRGDIVNDSYVVSYDDHCGVRAAFQITIT